MPAKAEPQRKARAFLFSAKRQPDRPRLAGQVWTTPDRLAHAGYQSVVHAREAPVAETYLTIKEVAEDLKTSDKTVRRLLQRGDLPGFKLGSTWRFRRSDIDEWAEKKIREATEGTRDGTSVSR